MELTERTSKTAAFRNLVLHLHPRTVPENSLKLTHTWGLGGMALVLFVLQVFTGTLLRFVYEPMPGKAYESIVFLQNDVLFGQLIRNIHHWSGMLLVVVVFLHLLRVFFTGAFHTQRQSNWLIGLSLLACVILTNFTGYLLPWDQLAYWAITVSTSMFQYIPGIGIWLQQMIRGGQEVDAMTLLRFYTLHTSVIPVAAIILMAFHFWRVRKAGGVVVPGGNSETDHRTVTTIPNLVLRELVVALVLIAAILIFSVFFNAPLQAKANPGFSPNPAKAPWYFAGIQELLLHFHPLLAVLLIPLFITCLLVVLPYIKYDSTISGTWFISLRGRRTGIVAALMALIITPLAIIADEYWVGFSGWLPGIPTVISNGFMPVCIVLAAIVGIYLFIKGKWATSNNEAIQAVFILLLVSFAILTVTGIWFRGPGMALAWPWNVG